MELKKETKGNIIKYTVIGEMSVEEARKFTEELMGDISKKKPSIEIDLADCEFMCSTGIGALAAALMVARSRGGDSSKTTRYKGDSGIGERSAVTGRMVRLTAV